MDSTQDSKVTQQREKINAVITRLDEVLSESGSHSEKLASQDQAIQDRRSQLTIIKNTLTKVDTRALSTDDLKSLSSLTVDVLNNLTVKEHASLNVNKIKAIGLQIINIVIPERSIETEQKLQVNNEAKEKELIKALKTHYKPNAKIEYIFDENTTVPIVGKYVNLSIIDQKEWKQKETKLIHQHPDKSNITINQLLDKKGRSIVIGRPGVGKSTFCKFIVIQWIENKLWINGQARYKYIFWIKLWNLTSYSKKELTLINIVNRECLGGQRVDQEMLKYLLASKQVLWLLDGFDEIMQSLSKTENTVLKDIIKQLAEKPCYILTSRPHAVSVLSSYVQSSDKRYEIKGFTDENIEEYINKFYDQVSMKPDEEKQVISSRKLIKYLRGKGNKTLWDIAHTPIQLELLCCVCRDKEITSVKNLTLTQLYEHVLAWLVLRDQKKPQNHQKNKDYALNFQGMRLLAFQESGARVFNRARVLAILNQVINAKNQENTIIPEVLLKQIISIGLLRETSSVRVDTSQGFPKLEPQYYFTHLSFQEYLVAQYIWETIPSKDCKSSDLEITPLNQGLLTQQPYVLDFLSYKAEEYSKHQNDQECKKSKELQDFLLRSLINNKNNPKLMKLMESCHLILVRYLMRQQNYFNYETTDQQRAEYIDSCRTLLFAAAYGRADWVKVMLDNEKDNGDTKQIESKDSKESNNTKLIEMTDLWGSTSLMWSAYNGHIEVMKLLVKNNANLAKENRCGNTALLSAFMQGHDVIVNWLIEGHAHDFIRDDCYVGLLWACQNNHENIKKKLQDKLKSMKHAQQQADSEKLMIEMESALFLKQLDIFHDSKPLDCQQKFNRLMRHVIRSEREKVNTMLEQLEKENPVMKQALLLAKGNVIDLSSDRRFESITALQYAYWAWDVQMYNILFNHCDEAESQLDELKTCGIEYRYINSQRNNSLIRDKEQFNIKALIESFNDYIQNWVNWDNKKRADHSCRVIGGEQRKLPINLAYELFLHDISVPGLKKDTPKHFALMRDWWFDQVCCGKLGETQALLITTPVYEQFYLVSEAHILQGFGAEFLNGLCGTLREPYLADKRQSIYEMRSITWDSVAEIRKYGVFTKSLTPGRWRHVSNIYNIKHGSGRRSGYARVAINRLINRFDHLKTLLLMSGLPKKACGNKGKIVPLIRNELEKRRQVVDSKGDSKDFIKLFTIASRNTLKITNKQHDSEIEKLLKTTGLNLGAALDKGDCFFDAFSQSLEDKGHEIPGKTIDSGCKRLRMLCNDYLKKPEWQQSRSWVEEKMKADANIGGSDYQTCKAQIQYTQVEAEENKKKDFFDGLATWGRPNIEGRILCTMLLDKIDVDFTLHIIDIEDNPDKVNGSSLIFIHSLFNKSGKIGDVGSEVIDYSDKAIIHIVNYKCHYVPLVSEKFLLSQQKNGSEEKKEKPPAAICTRYISNSREQPRGITALSAGQAGLRVPDMSNTNYWYSGNDITALLKYLLTDRAIVVSHTQLYNQGLLDSNLTVAIESVQQGKSVVIPLHLNVKHEVGMPGNHWAGIIIKKNRVGNLQVIYNDPRGTALEESVVAEDIVKIISKKYPKATIIDLHTAQQANDSDCGPFVVNNLVRLVEYSTSAINTEHLVGRLQVLLQAGPFAGSTIRRRHQHIIKSVCQQNSPTSVLRTTPSEEKEIKHTIVAESSQVRLFAQAQQQLGTDKKQYDTVETSSYTLDEKIIIDDNKPANLS